MFIFFQEGKNVVKNSGFTGKGLCFLAYAQNLLILLRGGETGCPSLFDCFLRVNNFSVGFKFNDEEAAKVNEAKKIQKWVSTLLALLLASNRSILFLFFTYI